MRQKLFTVNVNGGPYTDCCIYLSYQAYTAAQDLRLMDGTPFIRAAG
jgi:hypothetical protein